MDETRLKIWLSFWKWLISTVVVTGGVAWATIIINAKHKDTELQMQINREEREYLTNFLDKAMDDNLQNRYRFAQYFARLTTSQEYKKGWESYLSDLRKELEAAIAEKAALENSLAKKVGQELVTAQSRIAFLEKELSAGSRQPVAWKTWTSWNEGPTSVTTAKPWGQYKSIGAKSTEANPVEAKPGTDPGFSQ